MESPKENTKQQLQYKTDGGKTKSNAIEVPSITLPKGGGAIKGIDQKFTVNAVNGTAAFSIPLPVAAARGAAPALSLSYNSGGGNGIFGLGWNLNLPSIKRKTDKELPQYNDYIDSDTYLLSEAEDLVPEFKRESDGSFSFDGDGNFIIKEDPTSYAPWTIRFYKPRIEGLFARIERWTDTTSGEIKWRVTTKDNISTLYGWSSDRRSRICNPSDLSKIYEWLPELVFDDKGNCASYLYKAEDALGSSTFPSLINELHNKNRYDGVNITYTNLYPDKILYGNYEPFSFDNPLPSFIEDDFMFHTVFDYGQYDTDAPCASVGNWDFRTDAFSEYKSGFEIRTTRLCKRVLLYHYFENKFALNTDKVLVKSLDFYQESYGSEGFTFLKSITQKGYILYESHTNPSVLLYSEKSLPPVEFEYILHTWNKTVKEISPENLLHAPIGLSSPYQFTDLYNEGLSGILSEQAGGWYYKRNNGGGEFEAAHLVSPKPSFTGLGGALQLLDLDGDGTKQIVNFNGSPQGYFELNDDSEWQKFRSFKNLPNINLNDPNAKLIDLNGDGKTDVLITEDSVFTWWESEGREGFKERHRSPLFLNEEEGPKLIFAESKQTIFMADMSGDGLVDLVRIRNSEVCYWPNLGYGKFGKKITMNNAPVFDSDADFNPSYIKLADIDGSGTPDFIYLGKNKFTCWLNLSGNSFSTTPKEITGFPSIHKNADVTVTDLLGNGLSCIVWSSSLEKDSQAPLRYIDLMNSVKPHLMKSHLNNMGLETELQYTPSTKYYIDDKLAGTPWVTKLHFPVYCLSNVITQDKVTGNKFTSEYSYHHGYYDHAEKEFRGFGRVDQTDIEISEHWTSANSINLENADLNQAPVKTRSWFHTGAYTREQKILGQFAQEYWFEEYERNENLTALPVPAHREQALNDAKIVPDGLNVANSIYATNISPVEKRQALRSCKSMPLRTEVFALEGTPEEMAIPFTVGTHNCLIEILQPKGQNKFAVFCVKESEAFTYTYERGDTQDPRVAQSVNLEMDIYGNVLKSLKIVYPRFASPSLPSELTTAQDKTAILYTENAFTNDVIATDDYRLRLPSEVKTYEITGVTPSSTYFTLTEALTIPSAAAIYYYATPTGGTTLQKRLIEHVKSLYYANTLLGALGANTLESLGIPYENYQLAYTTDTGNNDLLSDIFTDPGMTPTVRATTSDLTTGKFLNTGDDWWVRSGVVQYIDPSSSPGPAEDVGDAKARFFVPISYTDPFNSITTVEYDALNLFVETTRDHLENTSEVVSFDYRTLSPVRMRDMNDNESEVLLDELGLPKAMAVYGNGSNGDGDGLDGLYPETLDDELADINDYFEEADAPETNSTNLNSSAGNLLLHATARFVYDFFSYILGEGPCTVSSILREEHYYVDSGNTKKQISFEYSNGSGKVVMKKIQAEPGDALKVTVAPDNEEVIDVDTVNNGHLRWIGNGRTVLNNKGNPVKQYEPYFSTTAGYERHKELVEKGVTPLLHYDALGRLIKTDFPDETFTKTEYYGWKQVAYDQNDTCENSDWYLLRDNTPANNLILTGQGKDPAKEVDAADKSYAHRNTPKTIHFDTRGRAVCEQEMPDSSTSYYTHLVLDIEGNLREVHDARGIMVMAYKYDMLGQMVYQQSSDSGKRWLLHNAIGLPLITWDERDHKITFEYDVLHRPSTVIVEGGDSGTSLNNIRAPLFNVNMS